MNSEGEILRKFKNGAIISSDEEMRVLEKWALIELVKFGADLIGMKAEASLTKRGKWLLPVLFKTK
ncbi:MAG: hypothetical protein ABH971_02550 [bacterium]